MNDQMLSLFNTLTKYPSIPTYHEMVNGRLTENVAVDFTNTDVVVTEKIDGSNARVIFVEDGFYIGSRERLLYCDGDRLYTPDQGIVEALLPWARNAKKDIAAASHVLVGHEGRALVAAYFEVYGGKINSWKQYTSTGECGFRLFDVWKCGAMGDFRDWRDLIWQESSENISRWRENNSQNWLNEVDLDSWANYMGVQRVPAYSASPGWPPESLESTADWLKSRYSYSGARLDLDAAGQAEGIVVRDLWRSKIAKLRFEDYRKALR